jgi:hypothetical protein
MADSNMQIDVAEQFPKWYATLELDDGASKYQERLNGLSNFATSAKSDDVEALIRLAWNSRLNPDSGALARFRKALNDADAAFPMAGNDKELRLLAGAALVIMICGSGSVQQLASLMVANAAFLGKRPQKTPVNLSEIARVAILNQAADNCRRPNLSESLSSGVSKPNLTAVIGKLNEGMTPDNVNAAIALASEAIRVSVTTLTTSYSQTIMMIRDYIKLQDEELEMLWWLTNRYSDSQGCGFDEVSFLQKPMVFANELASRTNCLPGPPSILGLLARAGINLKDEATVPEIISAMDESWVRSINLDSEPSAITAPIRFGLKKRQEAGFGDAWVPFWAATTGISEKDKFRLVDIGINFYRECLISKST